MLSLTFAINQDKHVLNIQKHVCDQMESSFSVFSKDKKRSENTQK